jgi:hypothetical protein
MIRTCGWSSAGEREGAHLPEEDLVATGMIRSGVGALVWEGALMLKVVHDVEASNEPAGGSLLDEIVRDGGRQILAAALQAEVAAYVEQFKDELDEHGRRLVVRTGFHAPALTQFLGTATDSRPRRSPG